MGELVVDGHLVDCGDKMRQSNMVNEWWCRSDVVPTFRNHLVVVLQISDAVHAGEGVRVHVLDHDAAAATLASSLVVGDLKKIEVSQPKLIRTNSSRLTGWPSSNISFCSTVML